MTRRICSRQQMSSSQVTFSLPEEGGKRKKDKGKVKRSPQGQHSFPVINPTNQAYYVVKSILKNDGQEGRLNRSSPDSHDSQSSDVTDLTESSVDVSTSMTTPERGSERESRNKHSGNNRNNKSTNNHNHLQNRNMTPSPSVSDVSSVSGSISGTGTPSSSSRRRERQRRSMAMKYGAGLGIVPQLQDTLMGRDMTENELIEIASTVSMRKMDAQDKNDVRRELDPEILGYIEKSRNVYALFVIICMILCGVGLFFGTDRHIATLYGSTLASRNSSTYRSMSFSSIQVLYSMDDKRRHKNMKDLEEIAWVYNRADPTCMATAWDGINVGSIPQSLNTSHEGYTGERDSKISIRRLSDILIDARSTPDLVKVEITTPMSGEYTTSEQLNWTISGPVMFSSEHRLVRNEIIVDSLYLVMPPGGNIFSLPPSHSEDISLSINLDYYRQNSLNLGGHRVDIWTTVLFTNPTASVREVVVGTSSTYYRYENNSNQRNARMHAQSIWPEIGPSVPPDDMKSQTPTQAQDQDLVHAQDVAQKAMEEKFNSKRTQRVNEDVSTPASKSDVAKTGKREKIKLWSQAEMEMKHDGSASVSAPRPPSVVSPPTIASSTEHSPKSSSQSDIDTYTLGTKKAVALLAPLPESQVQDRIDLKVSISKDIAVTHDAGPPSTKLLLKVNEETFDLSEKMYMAITAHGISTSESESESERVLVQVPLLGFTVGIHTLEIHLRNGQNENLGFDAVRVHATGIGSVNV